MTQPLTLKGIVDLASAFYSSAVLFAALDADIFTEIKKAGEAATAAEIARRTGRDGRGMRLLLDACVALGLLTKDADNVYLNTSATGQALVTGGHHDLTRAIRYNRDVYPAWGKLGELVKTGKPVEKPSIHLGDNPARTKAFAAAMFARAVGIGRSVVPMLGFPHTCEKVLDLAGGPAAYAVLIAKHYHDVKKIVTVDLPAISAEAKDLVATEQLSDRIECRAGDYHTDEYEKGAYDAVTIFGALHQESPADIVRILGKAAAALKKGGRIYVLDMMTDATHANPPFSALFAINMALTMPNGWVFSDEELKGWLADSGFTGMTTTHVPPPMPHWLVTAVKA